MNRIVGARHVLRYLMVCSLLFLATNLMITSFFASNNKCQTNESEKSLNGNRITIIITEFETFDNDLTETLRSICGLTSVTVLVVSESRVYPPVKRPNDCDIRFIDNDFHFERNLIESRIESHIKSDFVFVIPDSIRINSEESVFDSIKHLRQLNPTDRTVRTALILPIASTGPQTRDCIGIDFDIKRWTLKYSQRLSSDSCDAFGGENYAVLIQTKDLFELSSPLSRPFVESFYIQSKLRGIKNKLFSDIVFRSGRQLFTSDRNKWKYELWTKERRKWFFSFIGVKKVIESDGSVHWFGCDKQTKRCFPTVVDEMPDYLMASRWTPVCCIENLAKTGRHVFQVLESHSVRYWLEGGSLLGAARDGHIIPWDYDIDIGIYREDIDKCRYFPTNGSHVDEKGFLWEKASEGDFYRVHFSASNRLHVDIFPFHSRNGTMTKDFWFADHRQDTEFPEHYLKPLTRIRFIEWNAFAPNSVREFLEYKFGKRVIESPEYPKPDVMAFTGNNSFY